MNDSGAIPFAQSIYKAGQAMNMKNNWILRQNNSRFLLYYKSQIVKKYGFHQGVIHLGPPATRSTARKYLLIAQLLI